MRTKGHFLGSLVTIVAFGFLTACGGGGGSSSPSGTALPKTGAFSNVSGLGYSSGAQTGTTTTDGTYTYVPGSTVTFKVGDIVIGSAPAGSVVTPLSFISGADASNPQLVKIMQFLLSIGTYDPTTLTITIPAAVVDAAKGKSIDFATVTDADLLNMVKLLTGNSNAVLVDASTATQFLSSIIYKIFGGTYTGSFTGPATSTTWQLTIDASGNVTGKGLDGLQESITGSMTNGINLSATASGGCQLTGKLNVTTGVLSGTWVFPVNSQNGTFTGAR